MKHTHIQTLQIQTKRMDQAKNYQESSVNSKTLFPSTTSLRQIIVALKTNSS